MRWWISLKNMPELADLSENEKGNILFDSSMRLFGHWEIWLGMIGVMIFAQFAGSFDSILGVIAGGIGGGFLAPIAIRIQAWEIRKAVASRKPKRAP